jgi:iron complex transport system ATP-binding protein
MNSPTLEVTALDVQLDAHQILDQISLKVQTGQFIGIIGPNGSGKSTLIRCMSRALQPSAGSVSIDGRDITVFGQRELAAHLSVVPQESIRTFNFTVKEVVEMGRYIHQKGLLPRITDHDHEVCRSAMIMAGIEHLSERQIATLSGGEWQKVLIARTLAQETKIVLLDEPTSHLDVNHQIEILTAIKTLSDHGSTIIAVIHDLDLASHFCDQILLINSGKVVTLGSPDHVITPPLLKQVFDLDALVRMHPTTGKPMVVPLYPAPEVLSSGRRVHVICGGGSGSALLHALTIGGCTLTTGVLATNDSDYSTASQLHIPCITEPPFAPISDASRTELLGQIEKADVVVVTPMPIGDGNLDNLSVLEQGGKRPILFMTEDQGIHLPDFTHGAATALLDHLVDLERITVLSKEDVIRYCTGRQSRDRPQEDPRFMEH